MNVISILPETIAAVNNDVRVGLASIMASKPTNEGLRSEAEIPPTRTDTLL